MLTIPANDHGAIYVLELNRPAPDGLADKTDAAMMAVFGPAVVNTDYVDAITPGMLTDMTLADLCAERQGDRAAETPQTVIGRRHVRSDRHDCAIGVILSGGSYDLDCRIGGHSDGLDHSGSGGADRAHRNLQQKATT